MGHRFIKIPADTSQPLVNIEVDSLEYPEINNATIGAMKYIEVVRTKGLEHLANELESRAVAIIVDEEGLYHEPVILNERASYLYGTHVHHAPIVGDAFVIAEKFTRGDGWSFEGLPSYVDIEAIEHAIEHAKHNPNQFL